MSARPRTSAPEPDAARWLLLIHQIPPKPDYLRVKIGRRLQSVGAVAIKNSVYVLPANPEAYEDFQWIVREIEEGGGDAFVSEASLVGEELTDAEVRARFDAARNESYRVILDAARAVRKRWRPLPGKPGQDQRQAYEHELAKLRRRYEAVRALDFFDAAGGPPVAAAMDDLEQAIRDASRGTAVRGRRPVFDGATWVTRRDVHVDRIGSAWLICRFVDRRPRFKFVDAKRYAHRRGEIRFDMFEAEYGHVGDACTFETLVDVFRPGDAALRQIAEIVHDVDCKDGKFRRDEASGLARLIAGIAAGHPRDEDRLERGQAVFDDVYAAFGGRGR